MNMSKRVLFILMPYDFQDHEFNEPYTILKDSGHAVDVAGWNKDVAVGSFGLEHTPNLLFEDVVHDSYDAVVIPGGSASTEFLWGNDALHTLVRNFHMSGKLVATICYACAVPAQAGILKNKKATIYPTAEAKKLFEEHGAIFVKDGCVVLQDEKIITAQGPTFARIFGRKIAEFLS